MHGVTDEEKPKDKKKGRHVIRREKKIVWKFQYAKDFPKSSNRKKRRPPVSMEGFDERTSVPAKVPTPDLSSSEESAPSFCRARYMTRVEQAIRSERMLRIDHSLRHGSGSTPDQTNLTQMSCLNPSTTYPTVDITPPEIFKDAVESVQELCIGTPPKYYWFNEALAEVTNDEPEGAIEGSSSPLMQLFQKQPPVRWTD